MENEIYILKTDLVRCCEKIAGIGEDCFDEDFVASDGINRVIPYVETVEDENNSDRSQVFVHMDNGDVYELKMEKLSKEQLEHCNNFYGN